ncbi:MAG: HEAT repeat domain-containing protein [Acidobacteriota bacterium]|nr:HEAT repeat domain-containing protein [Acidobacteriota bacterium]
MRNWGYTLVAAFVALAPAFAQDDSAGAEVQARIDEAQARARDAMSKIDMSGVAEQLEKAKTALTLSLPDKVSLNLDMALAKEQLAFLQVRADGLRKVRTADDSGQYDAGTRDLDDRKYDEAIARFDRVIANKGDRADGALYWKAYALNRIGRRDEALAAIAALRQGYPSSRWLNDAQALEVEVKQSSGQPVSPADDANDDIKLMAINSLMNGDPDRAMPLLEKLLKGSASPRVKERALFVLTQSRAPRAQQILAEYAKGAGNPDLQLRAIRYIGMSGAAESARQLPAIYSASNDPGVKREIIRTLMVSQARDALMNIAKSEKDPDLRGEAVRQLGVMKAVDQLSQLYQSETVPDIKIQIVRSLMIAGANDRLLELAKNEKDENVRTEAIRNLALTNSASPEMLAGLYSPGTAPKLKREIVHSLMIRGDAKTMVDLARKESDPTMKKYIVQQLSVMRDNKDATDYMLELLK